MQSFCRTCFIEISDTSSSVPLNHESHKRQLMFCITEMDVRTFLDAKLCKECIIALNVMYTFKMDCRKVEIQFNKRQLMTEHPMITQDVLLNNNTVCRTCLKYVIDNSSHLAERPFYKSKLMVCVPEMDLQITSNINLCNYCHIIVNKIYVFKKKCLDVEKNIKEYLKLHIKIDFRDISVWCNALVKYEVNNLEDCIIKQEVDLVNEDELTEDVKEAIINTTLISLKTEELNTCECIEKKLKYQNYKCNNSICNNVQHLVSSKSKNNYKHSKCNYNHLHTSEKPFKCSLCGYSTADKSSLKIHIRTHTNEKLFKCTLCEYSAVQKSHLQRHINTHTGKKPFKCTVCEYSAAQKAHLQRHIYTHTGEKPFKCSLCEYSATNKSTLKNHIRTHTGEKPFKCSLCKYSAAQKSLLKSHIQTHTDEKPFKCSLCKYSTAYKSKLNKHIQTHTGEKPFKCLLCEYSAARKSTLNLHIRTHSGEKPFKCTLCEYSFTQKAHLQLHSHTHTGEKPFKCSLCEYSAAQKSHLIEHIRTHTGEKPFKCLLCKYSAAQKSSLRKHIQTHNSEKAFKCSLCGYSAAQKTTLTKHIRKHSSNNL